MSDSAQQARIGKFLKQVKREVILDDNTAYKLLGVKWYGKGAFIREEKTGKSIKAKKLYQVKTGDFIYNRLFAWKSSFAIIGEEFDGCLVSNEFPVFVYNSKDINIKYLLDYILLPTNIDYVNRMSKGVSGVSRNRFKEKIFLDMKLPELSIQQQNKISSKTNQYRASIEKIDCEITRQQTLLKKLRQSILQDAISGKLTEKWRKENPDVEPASELLKRIKAEKDRLIKENKIKKQDSLPPIKKEEIPFELPKRWEWCHLGDYALFERGKFSIRPRNDPSCFGGDYPFIQIGSLDNTGSVVSTFNQTLNEKGFAASKLFEQGTVMVAIVGGTIGNLGVLGKDMCFPDSMVGVRPNQLTSQDYILMLLQHYQPSVRELAYQMAGQPNIKLPTLNNLVCALPPLTEQKVLVDKVEKLLALGELLESQITKSQQDVESLMQAVLKEAFEG